MRVLICAATALALSACGYYHWSKSGADSAAFQRDADSCQQQSGVAAQPAAGPPSSGSSAWEACMNNLGWRYSSGW